MTKIEKKNLAWGYLFIAPAIIGLTLFIVAPMIFSFIISFTDWDMITSFKWIGLTNYQTIFTDDIDFWNSIKVTFIFAIVQVPCVQIFSFLLANLLNSKVKGVSIFRTLFYIPSILPFVAVAILWMFIYNPDFGLLNQFLGFFHIPPQDWLVSNKLVIPSLVIMAMWMGGGAMIISLAGLQGVPNYLYEAVEMDGGGRIHKFWYVTVPMMSPIIFFNAVMNLIGVMQAFNEAYIMTQGGPDKHTYFYLYMIYQAAFKEGHMGYASALAWILFVILVIVTLLVFRFSRNLIYYEAEVK
ncbi:spermidine/putrescine ABC transporter permease [Pullulanibacillus camelliae]|uniref:Spermidine/putrescine ABC transporter permease n=1 Tax=Pullulanibacillus camelliae TaxID=1707096 RepID=A0A8J2YEL6_9BACL|nr:sugar ABC transporter permease [Pullulanibacillus camelliae]GGE25816.1 spermidine/putrescine ABC transporter permease [Pullulanibacillus camelliae]